VRATAQLQIGLVGLPAIGKRNHVVILEVSPLCAPACGADERTLTSVALPHIAFHGGSDEPASLRGAVSCAGPGSGCVPGLTELGQQQRQRPIEDLGRIARRHLVPQKRLGLSQLLVHRA
jgi:hypothetical protein